MHRIEQRLDYHLPRVPQSAAFDFLAVPFRKIEKLTDNRLGLKGCRANQPIIYRQYSGGTEQLVMREEDLLHVVKIIERAPPRKFQLVRIESFWVCECIKIALFC